MELRRLVVITTISMAAAVGCGASGTAGTSDELTVRAVEVGPFEDVPTSVAPGTVTLRLLNQDERAHSLRVEELDDGVPLVPAGGEDAIELELEPGTSYTLFCDVPGHREAGMETSVMTAG